MSIQELHDKACAMLENVYLGLWVIGTELVWVCGRERAFRRHLGPLRKRRLELQNELAGLTLVDSPAKEATQAGLALLERDIYELEDACREAHTVHLQSLAIRFPQNFGA